MRGRGEIQYITTFGVCDTVFCNSSISFLQSITLSGYRLDLEPVMHQWWEQFFCIFYIFLNVSLYTTNAYEYFFSQS